MQSMAKIMSLASGFALMGYSGNPANLLATSIAINVSLAPLTAAIAAKRGRSGWLWWVIGLGFGMWALAWSLIFLSARNHDQPSSASDPHPPHAA